MASLAKLVVVSLTLITTGSTLANTTKSNSVSIEEITKEDKGYSQLLSEIVDASPSSVQLLNLSIQDFSNIEVKKEVTRIVEGNTTAAYESKSYSTCALDKTHAFSYSLEATWSSEPDQSEQQTPQWVLTSYKAKRQNLPCNA